MTTNHFATDLADKLFGTDAATTGTSLMRAALRLLAHGEPITVTQLATAADVSAAAVESAPAAQDIEYDDQRRIVGWGLTLNPTPHRFTVHGHPMYAWCAADTLLFPAIIGTAAQVESPCPTTGTPIRMTVDPVSGVTDLDPATAVISIPSPDELALTRVRATICNPGRFFATADAARDWLAQHPGGTVLPVADAYHQLRPISERVLGESDTHLCC
ncbi:organomercurial lyase MerB [Prauserella muralis]|uniref:Alkylmercury lyase n=1 Tax=Prauserella muralis TaxID=588067 RepID=A0A2V4AXI6_9PSEU|nr:organomercurial lyase MerB [Prauserella muralis]PXY25384.1 alkylmercury lyase [Prauserella muralis]TWE27498.1 alkylmercury lyase [Prauserella muralis]